MNAGYGPPSTWAADNRGVHGPAAFGDMYSSAGHYTTAAPAATTATLTTSSTARSTVSTATTANGGGSGGGGSGGSGSGGGNGGGAATAASAGAANGAAGWYEGSQMKNHLKLAFARVGYAVEFTWAEEHTGGFR